MPLALPHFLFYDLSILALVGMVIYGSEQLSDPFLHRDLLLAWIFVDAYQVGFMFIKAPLAQPPILVIVLAVLYVRMVKVANAKIQGGLAPLDASTGEAA